MEQEQTEWTALPDKELEIPVEYIKNLKYEVIVFARKERGGSDFTFRCVDYAYDTTGQWLFTGVVIDSSKRNAEGELELKRLSYHPEIAMVNVGFMVIPAPEEQMA